MEKKNLDAEQNIELNQQMIRAQGVDTDVTSILGLLISNALVAVSGALAAVICIEDPLRPEAADVIRGLRELGVTKLVMMTGDNEKTSRAVAEAVGVDA